MSVDFKYLQDKVRELGGLISAPSSLLVLRWEPSDDGSPHIVIEGEHFLYIRCERGEELCRKTTDSLDEILYWILRDVVRSMSIEFEFKNRLNKQDHRRIIFSKRIELFRKINPSWANRAESEINEILADAPYNDTPHRRRGVTKKSIFRCALSKLINSLHSLF
ncbi:MAG: immunity 63 family protein [Azoarcus sp.]|jgi:hypothetical protein|nr:immunity 63 family protein [Azoarcus sp.]